MEATGRDWKGEQRQHRTGADHPERDRLGGHWNGSNGSARSDSARNAMAGIAIERPQWIGLQAIAVQAIGRHRNGRKGAPYGQETPHAQRAAHQG